MQRRTRLILALLAASLATGSAAAPDLHPIVPKITETARPLPLTAVRLTGGPLKRAQELDADYLLKLEPDRMLAYYRERAGLEPKATPYSGWDGDKRNLTGHIAGHYLSAVSLMWAATGDQRFKDRATYIVNELKIVQDKQGDGYLGALAGAREAFAQVTSGTIKSSNFDLNGLWSPWYTLHKTYAGLRDAYRFTGNRTALDLEIKYAAWAESILSRLNDEQTQRMLNTEFGGMNEVLADLYADTGDKRWLDLSYRFEHRAVLDPLKRHEDPLDGVHVNMTIPKLIGSLSRFIYTGDVGDGFAAGYFWDRVVHHYTFATGGQGKDEYFREPDLLANIVDGRTAETCNVYNMLKMTRTLFALRPDPEYAEFQERALFNHILGSIDQDGNMCYMVPVGRGVRREYQDMFRSFTCCVGTGMENHALHGAGIYYEAGDRLWVNIYAPSTAEWTSAGARVEMQTGFPDTDDARLTLTLKAPKLLTIALRRPGWAGEGFSVTVNGKETITPSPAGSYVEITRTWNSGDAIALVMPKALHLEPTAGNPQRAAIMWGPIVLAGDLGPDPTKGDEEVPPPPVVVPALVGTANRPLTAWLKPVADRPGTFETDGVGRDRDVTLAPFYQVQHRVYAAYWDFYTPAAWEKHTTELSAERERVRRLDAATIDVVAPGAAQAEREHNQQGENTSITRVDGRPGRTGRGWFSYEMPVDPHGATVLVATYETDARRERTFDILVDGQRIAQPSFERTSVSTFVDAEYPIPADLVRGKSKVTVRFEATNGNDIAAVFALRTIRATLK